MVKKDAFPTSDENAASIDVLGETCEVVRVLKTDAFALTRLVRFRGALAVHKLSRVKPIWGGLRVGFFSRRLLRREVRLHGLLDGIPGIPRVIAQDGEDAFLHEWIPGVTLNVFQGRVGDEFFPRLAEIVRHVHARGVAYVDLAKDENIVVEEGTGRPYLIDFQVSVDFGESGFLRRAAGRRLQREDLYHLEKHVRRYRPDLAGRVATGAREKSLLNRLHRAIVKKPYNWVMRRLLGLPRGRPRGGGAGGVGRPEEGAPRGRDGEASGRLP